jgi:hypothetical protein
MIGSPFDTGRGAGSGLGHTIEPVEASAIFGFAGVLVGAGSAYVAQRGAEGRRNKANTRVGVRLSHLDLIAMRSTLRNALNDN